MGSNWQQLPIAIILDEWFDVHYTPEEKDRFLKDSDRVVDAIQEFLWNIDVKLHISYLEL